MKSASRQLADFFGSTREAGFLRESRSWQQLYLMYKRKLAWLVLGVLVLAGCAASPRPPLMTEMIYPTAKTEIEMGQRVRFIARVLDQRGHAPDGAQVVIAVRDSQGNLVTTLRAEPYAEDTFRTEAWSAPRRSPEGTWQAEIAAEAEGAEGKGAGTFLVKNATSETVLHKYGFWIDAPTLRGIQPMLMGERGDARNGMLRWGGMIPSSHILPANWVEIHWREGDFNLDSAETVRAFMLGELGDLGFTPVRELGPFERTRFKTWDAWHVGARGQLTQDEMEWRVFYAPEVNKTYALATTVVLPPANIDPHETLRASFEVVPSVNAAGQAPEPLVRLLPGPELTSPALGARFEGTGAPIVLEWKPVKALDADEFYQVSVDYAYGETTIKEKFATRATEFTLPESLYRTPNCHVFNWQVTLVRQTGTDKKGNPTGEPLSYKSLYWYVWWSYPEGEPRPFKPACPNPQF
jgi:hypothetical protein